MQRSSKSTFCNENSFPQSITTRMDAVNSCVAIVFYVPIKVEISLEKLKPLLRRKKVVKVYMDNVCMVDWSEQVFGTSMFPEREEYMSFINTIISIRGGGGGPTSSYSSKTRNYASHNLPDIPLCYSALHVLCSL